MSGRSDGSWSSDDPDRPQLTRDMEIVAIHDYDDGGGRYLYSKIKGINASGKAIRTGRRLHRDNLIAARAEQPHDLFKHPELTSYLRGDGGLPSFPYKLTKFLSALAERPDDLVFVTEGEGDTDTLHSHDLIATTNPNGAGKFKADFAKYFADRDVVVLADNDERGRAHAEQVASILIGVALSVRVIHLPGLPEKGDVTDWLGIDGNTVEALLGLVQRTAARGTRRNAGRTDEGPTRAGDEGVRLEDFHAFMPAHNYIFAPSREMWPSTSVNARIPPQRALDRDGNLETNEDGEPVFIPANRWLDQNQPVEQMTWAPGEPLVIRDRLISEGGWIQRPGCNVFNQYRPPAAINGDPAKAGVWESHVKAIYADEADHIMDWLAHRIQRPEEKINHALVFGGAPGIGKDTILHPVKEGVGHWNFAEVSPKHMLGRFNSYVKSVILRVSEARDLGDVDRFAFYDHMKTYTAAPPDVLRVDEKNLREYSAFNVCGVIITTNYKTDGIYLPEDDRRHFVAWSERAMEDFDEAYWKSLWDWYADGGVGHVVAFLKSRDLSRFQAKAPPRKTPAFWDIVAANRAPEEDELSDALGKLGSPDAVTLGMIADAAESSFADWLRDRKNARRVPHKVEKCGYRSVRNPNSKEGRWKVNKKDCVIYARADLSTRDQIEAAEKLAGEGYDVAM